jgi:hypothetical protein
MKNLYYMVYGDQDGECLSKLERPDRPGGYFIPLNESGGLYTFYDVQYVQDNVIYVATATRMCGEQSCFEVEFGTRKTSFGLFDNKKYKYVGNFIHSDFKYGFVEVGIKLVWEMFREEGIWIIGCDINRYDHKLREKIDSNVKSIFVSGGIGDIVSIDSFLSDEIKESIETVYYGSKQAIVIQKMFKAVPEYKNIKNHIIVWDDFNEIPVFMYKSECASEDKSFLQSIDFSIANVFPQFSTYNKSVWIDHTLCEIKVELPEDYVVICPYSINLDRSGNRNFSEADWVETLKFLEKKNIKGIVLNGEKDPVLQHLNLIDYSGQTDILESIEILKKSKYYIGIDSSFGVLAAKLLAADHIVIKMISLHGISWKNIYWAPQTEFPFLKNKIDTSLLN